MYYQESIPVLLGGELDQSDVTLLIQMIVNERNLFTDGNKEKQIHSNNIDMKYNFSRSTEIILGFVIENTWIMANA